MWRSILALAAVALSFAQDQENVQHEFITTFRKTTIFETDVYVGDDEFNDFGYYATEEACKDGAVARAPPEDVWRFKGEIDVCATSGTGCYAGKTVSSGRKAAIKFAATETSLVMTGYGGDSCDGGFFSPEVKTITLSGEDRKDFVSGRCVKAELFGVEYWGHLEIRKNCAPEEEEAAGQVDKDTASGPRLGAAAAMAAASLLLG
mmetsp:Transcript_105395/g.293431  ORF Transcript_105395/g.293431 Transcript_105395/m.293431 type:complete len:205 (-) Transcript_105395:69-683(-)